MCLPYLRHGCLEIRRNSKSFGGGVGVSWGGNGVGGWGEHDFAFRNEPVSFNQCSKCIIVLGKCVCQLQMVSIYLTWLLGASSLTHTWALSPYTAGD